MTATTTRAEAAPNTGLIKGLTYMMFMMFAMTTDSVGVIIPEVIKEFGLGMTAAGSFHYATMGGIALAGIALGFLVDRLGRKAAIIVGLALFSLSAFLFAVGQDFGFFVLLLFISGAAIGVFKTAALALIGDISTSTRSHTATMNTVEGWFGVGAILGPAVVAWLLVSGMSWKWLYVIAGGLSVALIVTALMVRYPKTVKTAAPPADLKATVGMMRDPYALAFSLGTMLYVGVETAIYVWMPTLLAGYEGPAILVATYALSIFFVLRAAGRFLGAWMLNRYRWTTVLVVASLLIFACFLGSALLGRGAAVFLLPLSGLFMSVIYPTLNSKGISCFAKVQHGAVAGVILFFTCISAVLAPLAMGAVSDAFGGAQYGFVLATILAGVLFAALAVNAVLDPAKARLARFDDSQYGV
ncbi:MFS transporter [Brevundimonas variabilis]|uniref:Fucose permease n=1 Tax=Brevundimonas variabilis TaxID=74312 RepID=A0A7W9FF77_9CAUL|nr:MFS transporter [Brevundimonas variabilis]MBB5747132.1 fucose permease [Brevundimonas variabilis]